MEIKSESIKSVRDKAVRLIQESLIRKHSAEADKFCNICIYI